MRYNNKLNSEIISCLFIDRGPTVLLKSNFILDNNSIFLQILLLFLNFIK